MRIGSRGRPRSVATVLAAALAVSLVAIGATPGTAPAAEPPRVPDLSMIEGLEPGGTAVVNLITGQQVIIESLSGGGYQVDADPTTGGPDTATDLNVRAEEVPGQPVQLVAEPPGTGVLVEDGLVDPHLFDLSHLVAHGYGTSETPVTVHFQEEATPEEIAAAVAALPGSRLAADSATSRQATALVPAGERATFWDAVTTVPPQWAQLSGPLAAHVPRQLAEGLAGLTLAGADLPLAEPPSVTPTYQLTVRIHGSDDRSRWPGLSKAVIHGSFSFTPVTGHGESSRFPAFQATCQDPECRTAVFTMDLAEGVWWVRGKLFDRNYGGTEYTEFLEPELVIDGDTTLDLYADDAIWIEPDTPQPTELARLAETKRRTMPDGSASSDLHWREGDGLGLGMWVVPSQHPASTGAFNMTLTQVRQQPRISLSVSKPKADLTLHSQYVRNVWWIWEDSVLGPDGATLPVVDVGDGSEADFAGVDATGKLLLLAMQDDSTIGCVITDEVQQRVIESGAAGVLVDSDDSFFTFETGRCDHPIGVSPRTWEQEDPGMPYISLPPDEAASLRGLLAAHEVRLQVGSPANQRPQYTYLLGQHFTGGYPEQIPQTFTERDLVTRESRLHGTAGLGSDPYATFTDMEIRQSLSARTAQLTLLAGTSFYGFGVANEPMEITEHIGPVSPDVTWSRGWRTVVGGEFATDIFPESGRAPEEWLAAPIAIGPEQSTEDAWPGTIYQCNFCRMGDVLVPFAEYTPGGQPTHSAGGGLPPGTTLTDADGAEIPLGVVDGVFPAYHLPPEPQRYTLRAGDRFGASYEWTFHSGPAADNRPPYTTCFREMFVGNPCGEPVPMIYLTHDAPVDIDNTAPAGGRHTVTVGARHQTPDPPAIESVTTEVSFDDGETWQDAKVKVNRDGTRRVTFRVPALAETNGFVSLRTSAADAGGNSTVQTLVDAYELR